MNGTKILESIIQLGTSMYFTLQFDTIAMVEMPLHVNICQKKMNFGFIFFIVLVKKWKMLTEKNFSKTGTMLGGSWL